MREHSWSHCTEAIVLLYILYMQSVHHGVYKMPSHYQLTDTNNICEWIDIYSAYVQANAPE